METMTPHSVTLITPRWARDGGVAAHVQATAQLLAREGVEVTVLAESIESQERIDRVTLYHREQLCNWRAPANVRLGEMPCDRPAIAHLHQIDETDIVAALQE